MATLTRITYPEEPTAAFDIDAQVEAVSADAAGDDFHNGAGTKMGFWVKSTAGAQRTVTFDAPSECNHGFMHDEAITVPDAFEGFIKIGFDGSRFNDANGDVSVTYDNEAGLEVAAVILPF